METETSMQAKNISAGCALLLLLFGALAGEAPVAYAFADSGPIQALFCTVSGRDIVLP